AAEPVVAPTAATPPSRSPSRRASWIGIGIATCCALVVGALLGAGISMGGAARRRSADHDRDRRLLPARRGESADRAHRPAGARVLHQLARRLPRSRR